jgi:fatty acid desaturase
VGECQHHGFCACIGERKATPQHFFIIIILHFFKNIPLRIHWGAESYPPAVLKENVFLAPHAGGLNYQIEHHLFPTLPRHNLAKIRTRVMELCRKHGLVYEECGMATGTRRVLERLAQVGLGGHSHGRTIGRTDRQIVGRAACWSASRRWGWVCTHTDGRTDRRTG